MSGCMLGREGSRHPRLEFLDPGCEHHWHLYAMTTGMYRDRFCCRCDGEQRVTNQTGGEP